MSYQAKVKLKGFGNFDLEVLDFEVEEQLASMKKVQKNVIKLECANDCAHEQGLELLYDLEDKDEKESITPDDVDVLEIKEV